MCSLQIPTKAGIQNLADDGDAGLDAGPTLSRGQALHIRKGLRNYNRNAISPSPVQEETEKDLQHRRPVSQR